MSLIETRSISAKDVSTKMMYHTFYRRALLPHDIHFKVSYSGICHSDIHAVNGEWSSTVKYPQCVGHEIIGTVVAVGSEVTKFKVGDAAGVGCFTDSCRQCDECKEGDEQYCSGPGGMHGTYTSVRPDALHPGGRTQGGYSSDFVVDENYAIKVPEKLNVAAAAPLLCAGITCYSPFRHYGLKPGMKLGVVGLGGLGHMAVKIGAAMGAEVTVLTRSPGKVDTAKGLGAHRVVISTDPDQMQAAARSLDMIYNSIAFSHDVKSYLGLLRSSGTMIMVGLPPGAMNVNAGALVGRRLKLVGSCIGGIRETQEMIDFCAEHDIVADIELIKATPEAVDEAWRRCIASDVKFRFVIDTAATLDEHYVDGAEASAEADGTGGEGKE